MLLENVLVKEEIKEIIKNKYPDYNEFVMLWLEQETDQNDSFLKYLAEVDNLEEFFELISLWSISPINERIENFIKNN